METTLFLLSCIVASLFFHIVDADSIICGSKECRGGSPYCCELDDGTVGCCWDSSLFGLWWFWAFWFIIFLMIFACCFRCMRRRQQIGVRYVVMSNSEYPSYGTVVHPPRVYNGTSPTLPPSASAPAGAAAPVKPPPYAAAAAEASKPPPYRA